LDVLIDSNLLLQMAEVLPKKICCRERSRLRQGRLQSGCSNLIEGIPKMLMSLRQLLELIRFSHTLFALPFALLAAVLAWRETEFRPQNLIGILLCMVFARSAAMAFNRLVDRKIDAHNPRTAGRHLPAGLLSVSTVVSFTILCSAGFISSTLLFLPNRWPIFLSVPVLMFLLGYSYAKRFTVWSHYWLSAALMLSPIAAWIAVTGRVDLPPVILAGVVFFWVGGFDILYACQDVEFDREKSLFSVPSRWGIPVALRLALVSHVFMIGCLFGLWYAAALGSIFLAGILAVTGLLAYEHWLVRPDDLTRVNIAFFQVNAIISLGLLLVGAADVWLG
jgi:4-hydroxybenzoate polyprenyltransferase